MHMQASPPERTEQVGRAIVNTAKVVHRKLGPGLLQSVYEVCLTHELAGRGHDARRQVSLPVVYNDIRLEAGYRVDLFVDDAVMVQVKAVDAITRIHEEQLRTYLRLAKRRLGYLINFNVIDLSKDGVKRIVV